MQALQDAKACDSHGCEVRRNASAQEWYISKIAID